MDTDDSTPPPDGGQDQGPIAEPRAPEDRRAYFHEMALRGERHFIETGRALSVIRGEQLYLGFDCRSFEHYIETMLDMDVQRAYQLIRAFRVVVVLRSPATLPLPLPLPRPEGGPGEASDSIYTEAYYTVVESGLARGEAGEPRNEAQARPLGTLLDNPGLLRAVWYEVLVEGNRSDRVLPDGRPSVTAAYVADRVASALRAPVRSRPPATPPTSAVLRTTITPVAPSPPARPLLTLVPPSTAPIGLAGEADEPGTPEESEQPEDADEPAQPEQPDSGAAEAADAADEDAWGVGYALAYGDGASDEDGADIPERHRPAFDAGYARGSADSESRLTAIDLAEQASWALTGMDPEVAEGVHWPELVAWLRAVVEMLAKARQDAVDAGHEPSEPEEPGGTAP